MAIDIRSSEELNKLLDVIANQVVDANIYYRLLSGIREIIPKYTEAYAQSRTFWYLTMEALSDACIIRLCRAFDQRKGSLHFVSLLETIKANRHLFGQDKFRERLKGNPFVESLAQDARIPSIEQIDDDLQFSSRDNPLVGKLVKWRDTVYAHSGAKAALGEEPALINDPLLYSEIEILLDKSFEFLNRYLSLFKATTWSRQIIGHDDYKYLFEFIQIGLNKEEEDIQKQMGETDGPY